MPFKLYTVLLLNFFCYFEQEETDKIGEMNDLTVTVAAQIAIAFLIVI